MAVNVLVADIVSGKSSVTSTENIVVSIIGLVSVVVCGLVKSDHVIGAHKSTPALLNWIVFTAYLGVDELVNVHVRSNGAWSAHFSNAYPEPKLTDNALKS
jgi:hypothetical protein